MQFVCTASNKRGLSFSSTMGYLYTRALNLGLSGTTDTDRSSGRGRGRGRGTAGLSGNVTSGMDIQRKATSCEGTSSSPALAQPSRGRGRPRKEKDWPSLILENVHDDVNDRDSTPLPTAKRKIEDEPRATPKKRGRPPKAKNDTPASHTLERNAVTRPILGLAKETAVAPTTQKPKKRGRPPNVAISITIRRESTATDTSSEEDDDSTSENSVSESEGADERDVEHTSAPPTMMTPKRRGRPPKASASSSTAPKRRGRPPKTKMEGEPVAKPRGRPPKANLDNNTTPKRRGRPPKAKEVDDSTPKRRGRPPKIKDGETLTKKRRGRPPKADAFSVSIPRPRGRPPKPRTDDDAIPKRQGRPPKNRENDASSEFSDEEENNIEYREERIAKVLRQFQPSDAPLPLLHSSFSLQYVMRGHLDRRGKYCDVRACEFEPPLRGKPMNTVAICSENTVLLLDTQKRRYEKKYTHPEQEEEFICLAWTTLQGPEALLDENVPEDDACNILAVAGRLGSIKLINPLQNVCYRYLFGHQGVVVRLAFAKPNPRWLFSASTDMTVRLWDIGTPQSDSDNSMPLAKFSLPTLAKSPSTLSLSLDMSTLIVGCTSGFMARYTLNERLIHRLETKVDQVRDRETVSRDKWTGLGAVASNIKPSEVYPAGGEWHEGLVDDIQMTGQNGDISDSLSGFIVSRGTDDAEILIWNPSTSRGSDADVHMSLEWTEAEEQYTSRFKVVENKDEKALVAGDHKGGIQIFDIGSSQRSRKLADGSVEQTSAVKTLSHSLSTMEILDVTLSESATELVAIGSDSRIFVWRSDG